MHIGQCKFREIRLCSDITRRPRRGRLLTKLLALTVTVGAVNYSVLAADDGTYSSMVQEGERRDAGIRTPAACKQLVWDAGRMVAWARWDKGLPLERTRSVSFPPDTPAWMVAQVQNWITDAYQWQPTDDQVFEWAAELGNVEDLPRADRLSKHVTTAIWLRRIARMCTQRREELVQQAWRTGDP